MFKPNPNWNVVISRRNDTYCRLPCSYNHPANLESNKENIQPRSPMLWFNEHTFLTFNGNASFKIINLVYFTKGLLRITILLKYVDAGRRREIKGILSFN